MARPGYVSLYADERTQKIFDEFIATKGITKSTALTDMMTIQHGEIDPYQRKVPWGCTPPETVHYGLPAEEEKDQ